MENEWEALGNVCRIAIEAMKVVCNEVSERIVKPIYDGFLLAASAENPKWYHYYKNAKTKRTRKKYEVLLQNRLILLLAETK